MQLILKLRVRGASMDRSHVTIDAAELDDQRHILESVVRANALDHLAQEQETILRCDHDRQKRIMVVSLENRFLFLRKVIEGIRATTLSRICR